MADSRHIAKLKARWRIQFALSVTLILFLNCCSDKTETGRPDVSATEAALSAFEIAEGFRIELLASEPLLGDPVDMEIDEFGRLYVVEMPGYPLDQSGSGKVLLLRDTDGDGRMDDRTVFASNMVLPNSLMRWKKGIMVTDAPHVLYFEDTNDDGQADIRDTLLTGFALSNPQHNLNSPVLGLDNWIYLAHEGAVATETYEKEFGDPGTEVYYPDKPQGPRLGINANGRAVRFKPDRSELEVISSRTQFGHTFDQWGRHLLVGNANHIYHEVIAERYLERNPRLTVPKSTHDLSDHGNAAEVFPITENPQHQLLTDVGVITSACGLTAYLGGAFPDAYNDNTTFVAEPVSNIIHADRLRNDGATFVASRIQETSEFLASRDARFRPVNMYVGPDGALYVVDYYRQIIEHPEWMGEEVIRSGELYNDMDKGRIYRISATDAAPAEWTKGLTLGNAGPAELVQHLGNRNLWWRQHAQRLILDLHGREAIPALTGMLGQGEPTGRLHALWTLHELGALRPEHLTKALADPSPGVRENAILICEQNRGRFPDLDQALTKLSDDPDPRVRFQLLCTLGNLRTPASERSRQAILARDISDPWIHLAFLSATNYDYDSLLGFTIKNYQANGPAFASFARKLAWMAGSSHEKNAAAKILKSARHAQEKGNPDLHAAIIDGLFRALEHESAGFALSDTDQSLLINWFFTDPNPAVRKACLHLLSISKNRSNAGIAKALDTAAKIASDTAMEEGKRADAIEFMSIGTGERFSATFQRFLSAGEPLGVQLAALRSMSKVEGPAVSYFLVNNWSAITPGVQDPAIGTFLKNPQRIKILLDAIDNQKIAPSSVSWPRRVQLMAQSDDVLRNRSRKIFTYTGERETNRDYAGALKLKGDVSKGKEIFIANCSLCHQVRGKSGVPIGPDLGTIHNWSREAILANTLSPNLSISSGFDLWSVELRTGQSFQGLIATETPGAITLRNNGSPDRIINRKDIRALKALNMSIMPSGFDKQINQEQMADLLAFLKQNK